jgi:hypothetical protein
MCETCIAFARRMHPQVKTKTIVVVLTHPEHPLQQAVGRTNQVANAEAPATGSGMRNNVGPRIAGLTYR